MSHPEPSEGPRIEVASAAKRLRCSESHVRRLIEAGELQAVNVARGTVARWQVVVASLDAFLARRST